jgi:hypothetical protein
MLVCTQDEDQYGAVAVTMSLAMVNIGIAVLFCYLSYCTLRDLVVEDEAPHRREQLTALLQNGSKLSKELLQWIVTKAVHTKTSDQDEELKAFLNNQEAETFLNPVSSTAGDTGGTEHTVMIDEEPSIQPGIEMAVFGSVGVPRHCGDPCVAQSLALPDQPKLAV